MSDIPQAGAPLPPPPPPGPPAVDAGGRTRPWWNELDLLLAIVWFIFAMIVAGLVSAFSAFVGGVDILDEPVYAIFFGTLAFQVLQATYPWLVSKRKGLGLAADWRFAVSLPSDVGRGFLLGLACLVGAQIVTVSVALAVGLDNSADASNTDILTDNQNSPWIVAVILMVIIGAPLAEELLFRGLILRILQKSFGTVAAIVVSSLLFALPHWQPNATWQETMVLLSALGTVGVILAIGAVRFDRLGPPIIAHFFFNAAGTIFTLL